MKVPRGRGDYDRRISIFKATVSSNADSNETERAWSETPYAKRWAQRVEVPPSLLRDERYQAFQHVAKSWVGFRIPFDQALYLAMSTSEHWRVVDTYGGVFDIIEVQELPRYRRRTIDIMGYERKDKAEVVS